MKAIYLTTLLPVIGLGLATPEARAIRGRRNSFGRSSHSQRGAPRISFHASCSISYLPNSAKASLLRTVLAPEVRSAELCGPGQA